MSIRVDSQKIKQLVTRIFEKSGAKSEEAATVADNLVQAEMRGIRSHGLVQVANYSKLMRSGKINCSADIKIIRESESTLSIDADHAPGSVAGKYAMARTIEKARKNGVAISTVKNATHFGFAAYYAMDALAENFIGLSFTSTGLGVAPFGGFEKMLGTNPICVAVPAGKERPVVFDAATSNAAFNKCFFAYTEGRKIPSDWALDKDGKPTTDPADVVTGGGALLPFGGYKGYGLGLIVFIITTLLSGTSVIDDDGGKVTENTKKVAYNFAAIDISRFTDVKDFKENLDVSIRRLKNSKKLPGTQEIYISGEIEFNLAEKAEKEGLEIFDGVESEINRTLRELGFTETVSDSRF